MDWIGLVLIAIAVIVFVFQITIENGGLHARPNRTRILGIGAMALAAAAATGWYFWPEIEETVASCKLSPVVGSRIVARLHGRLANSDWPRHGGFSISRVIL
jgi:hypothetical protein